MNFMNDLGMSFFVVVIVLLKGEVLVLVVVCEVMGLNFIWYLVFLLYVCDVMFIILFQLV